MEQLAQFASDGIVIAFAMLPAIIAVTGKLGVPEKGDAKWVWIYTFKGYLPRILCGLVALLMTAWVIVDIYNKLTR